MNVLESVAPLVGGPTSDGPTATHACILDAHTLNARAMRNRHAAEVDALQLLFHKAYSSSTTASRNSSRSTSLLSLAVPEDDDPPVSLPSMPPPLTMDLPATTFFIVPTTHKPSKRRVSDVCMTDDLRAILKRHKVDPINFRLATATKLGNECSDASRRSRPGEHDDDLSSLNAEELRSLWRQTVKNVLRDTGGLLNLRAYEEKPNRLVDDVVERVEPMLRAPPKERARLLEEASLSTGYEELTMGQFHQAYDRCFDILRRLQDSEESLLKERHAKEISDFEHGPERAWSHICWEGTFNEALRSGVVGRLSHVTMYTEHMFQIPLGEAIQTKGLSPDWDRMLPQLNRERCRFGLLAVSKSEPKDSFDNMHRLLRQAHDSNKFVWLERVTLDAGLLSIYLIPMSKVIVPKAQTARNPSLREAVGRPGHTFLVAMILAGDSGDPVAALGPRGTPNLFEINPQLWVSWDATFEYVPKKVADEKVNAEYAKLFEDVKIVEAQRNELEKLLGVVHALRNDATHAAAGLDSQEMVATVEKDLREQNAKLGALKRQIQQLEQEYPSSLKIATEPLLEQGQQSQPQQFLAPPFPQQPPRPPQRDPRLRLTGSM